MVEGQKVSYSGSKKILSFLALGISFIFVQVPFGSLVAGNERLLAFEEWNPEIFWFLSATLFIVIPLTAFLVLSALSRLPRKTFEYLVSIFICLLAVKSIDYYFIKEFYGFYIRILSALLIFTIFIFFAVKKFDLIIAVLSINALFIPVYFGYFAFTSYPGLSETAASAKAGEKTYDVENIYILTFEKLVPSIILDEGHQIRQAFPNLRNFATSSDVFTDAHAPATATMHALRSLLTGEFLPEGLFSKFSTSMFEEFGNDRTVYILNDYGTSNTQLFCDPLRHQCVSSLGEESRGTGIILRALAAAYLETLVPGVVVRVLGVKPITGFGDLFEEDGSFERYTINQFDRMVALSREAASERKLVMMHSFLTDGAAYASGISGNVNDRADVLPEKKARVELFDRKLGEFIKMLRETGQLDTSLVLITSDTGSAKAIYKNMQKIGVRQIDITPEVSGVFLLVHWPGQVDPRLYHDTIDHTDIIDLLKEGLDQNEARGQPSMLNGRQDVVISTQSNGGGYSIFKTSRDRTRLDKVE